MSAKAPGDLELLRSFVNTADPDTRTDELDTPQRMHDWLAARGLLGADSTVDEQAHRQTLELREALRALALANGATELDPTVIATLNELATGTSLSVLLNPDGHAELHPTEKALNRHLGNCWRSPTTQWSTVLFHGSKPAPTKPAGGSITTIRKTGRRNGVKCRPAAM